MIVKPLLPFRHVLVHLTVSPQVLEKMLNCSNPFALGKHGSVPITILHYFGVASKSFCSRCLREGIRGFIQSDPKSPQRRNAPDYWILAIVKGMCGEVLELHLLLPLQSGAVELSWDFVPMVL